MCCQEESHPEYMFAVSSDLNPVSASLACRRMREKSSMQRDPDSTAYLFFLDSPLVKYPKLCIRNAADNRHVVRAERSSGSERRSICGSGCARFSTDRVGSFLRDGRRDTRGWFWCWGCYTKNWTVVVSWIALQVSSSYAVGWKISLQKYGTLYRCHNLNVSI